MRRVLALGCGGAPAPRERLDEARLWGAVAPLAQALTFARRSGPAGPELLLVASVHGGRVDAVPLPEAADPIALLERMDAAAVRRAAAARPRVSVPLAALVWFVVVGGDGFVRTNDSRWRANIRRGSPLALRLDAAVTAAVEKAFLQKYGFAQGVMSAFRMREPTVLRVRPKQAS